VVAARTRAAKAIRAAAAIRFGMRARRVFAVARGCGGPQAAAMASEAYDDFVARRLPPPEAWPDFAFDRPELAYPERMNAAVELLDAAVARGEGDGQAVVNDAGEWTYAQLKALSDGVARVLVEQGGLIPGARVLLRGPNTMTLIAAWFGVLKAGGIVVTTMPMLRRRELAPILARAQVSHAIVDSRCLADWSEAAAEAPALKWTITYDGDAGTGALEAAARAAAPEFAAHVGRADAPALIAFTSGTTGDPKGCVHDHRAILAPADTFARHVLKPAPGQRWIASPPIAFTFGLGGLVLFPFRFAGTAVTVENGSPPNLIAAAARHRANLMFTAPTAYKAMLPLLADHDLSALHTCISAGEHLPPAVLGAWKGATGLTLVNGIGATEMMHIFISAAGADVVPGATGRVVPGYTACVLDDEGNPLEQGEGRLAVRGPTGCRYLDDPRQAVYVRDGWNVTGDTYRLDADGYFHYVARSDDMIVSSGYNIAAPEVENALLSHAAVSECAVCGVPDAGRGMIVKAWVVASAGVRADAALAKALQDHVKAEIAPYKYPRAIEFVDALPKTLTGKLQRYRLRADAGRAAAS
jgi:2-aminobenzoate-CoA ligase